VLASLALVVSAPIVAWSAAGGSLWFRLAFQVLVGLIGVTGVLAGLGRFRSGPAWALASLGFPAALAAFLSLITGGFAQGARFTPGGLLTRARLNPFIAAELVAGLTLVTLAALTLMARRPGVALRRCLLGAALLAPVIAGAGLALVPAVRSAVAGLHPVAIALGALIALLAAIVLISAGGHFVIRALEAGVDGADDAPSA